MNRCFRRFLLARKAGFLDETPPGAQSSARPVDLHSGGKQKRSGRKIFCLNLFRMGLGIWQKTLAARAEYKFERGLVP